MQSQNPHRVRLPVIPDLRFETSYLRSVTPYIHVSPNDLNRPEEKSQGKGKVLDTAPSTNTGQVVVRIEWGGVAWITARDQVISPMLQGALWAVASHYIAPLLAAIRSKLRTRLPLPGHGEGSGVEWLRSWIRGLVSGVGMGGEKRL